LEAADARVGSDRPRLTGENIMSTITQQSPQLASAEPAHPVSEMIDATEVLYRLTIREYEQIAGILDDDRVELIDGYLVKKMDRQLE
jgi:hypothetical protein